MRLSTKGIYALEAMVLLGYKSKEHEYISIRNICDDTNISEGYLEQLFSSLKKHQIIQSKKGKHGGYYLHHPASEIYVGDIFRAVEGSLAPVKCTDSMPCEMADGCITKRLWDRMYGEINNVVNEITLEALVTKYENKLKGNIAS